MKTTYLVHPTAADNSITVAIDRMCLHAFSMRLYVNSPSQLDFCLRTCLLRPRVLFSPRRQLNAPSV